ncbi:MAG: hypothetical protein IT210_12680 [Armatimonadetes bacterium]|nr:hypothetical protein [Armatimonadota bacterium]
MAISRRETKTAYRYERKKNDVWTQHIIGVSDQLAETLGAAVLDIDHDGWLDIAFSRVWFKKSGCLARDPLGSPSL